ncbi:hypothetical protein ACTAZI_10325 [Legionella bozemanae]|uniref:hypothetical protein n=1 Tax=Legionella bozemanae TaxID=447 RepID=UPI003EEA9A1A
MLYQLKDLIYKASNEFINEFTTLSTEVTALDLSKNGLDTRLTDEFVQGLTSIAPKIKELYLADNFLVTKPGADLAKIFAAIPSSVTFLHLGSNLLGNKKAAELAEAFAAIPAHVTTLRLDDNFLNNFSQDDLLKLKGSLTHVKTLYVSYTETLSMTTEQRQALKMVFPQIATINLVDPSGKVMELNNSFPLINLVRSLGGKTSVPSLLVQGTMFVKNNNIDYQKENAIPSDLKEFVSSMK